jgi:hypothetical protein
MNQIIKTGIAGENYKLKGFKPKFNTFVRLNNGKLDRVKTHVIY